MNIVYTFLSGLLIALVSSFVAVRLALWRFHSEKWWERKAELYSRLLEALYDIVDYHAKWIDDYESGASDSRGSSPEQIAKKKAKDEALLEREQRAKAEVDKISVIGAFIVSDAVADDLLLFQKAEREAWGEINHGDTYSGVDLIRASAERCLRAVREHAKEDLGLKRKLPPLVADFFASDAMQTATRAMTKVATDVLRQ